MILPTSKFHPWLLWGVLCFQFFSKGRLSFLIVCTARSVSVIYFVQLCLNHLTYWRLAVITGGYFFPEHFFLLEYLLTSHTQSWESKNSLLPWAPSGCQAAPGTKAGLHLACDERLCPWKVHFSSWSLGLAGKTGCTWREVSYVIRGGRGACCETSCHEIELQVSYSSSLKLLHFTMGFSVCLEQISAIYQDAKRWG